MYLYVVFYSASKPQQALLAVNTLQKGLSAQDYVSRLLSLKAICGLKVREVSQVMLLELGKAVRDLSPHVRRAASVLLPPLFDMDPSTEDEILELLETLLDDADANVVGAALQTYAALCETHWAFVHPVYRKVCADLGKMDEWNQITAMTVLERYARSFFRDPKGAHGAAHPDGAGEREEELAGVMGDAGDAEEGLEPDHRLLVDSVLPLVSSTNTSVAYHAALLLYRCGPASCERVVAQGLLRLLHTNPSTQFYVLDTISTLDARLFRGDVTEFFVRTFDTARVRRTKLEVLSRIADPANIRAILAELQCYAADRDTAFAREAVKAIGRCAMNVPEVAETCQQFLIEALDKDGSEEAVVVLRQILQLQHKERRERQEQQRKQEEEQQKQKQKEEEQEQKEQQQQQQKEELAASEKDVSAEVSLSHPTGTVLVAEDNCGGVPEADSTTAPSGCLGEERQSGGGCADGHAGAHGEGEGDAEPHEHRPETPTGEAAAVSSPSCGQPDEAGAVSAEEATPSDSVPREGAAQSAPAVPPAAPCDRQLLGVVMRLARLFATSASPLARASILFVIGEYAPRNGSIAAEVLRCVAKTFREEDAQVKLEALALAAKLLRSAEARDGAYYGLLERLAQYLFTLARYDQDFDVRDRARLLRALLSGTLAARCGTLLLREKPVPQVVSPSATNRFDEGTMSHLISEPVAGYAALPPFADDVPPPSVRDPVAKAAPSTPEHAAPALGDDEALFGADGDGGEDGEDDDAALFGGAGADDGWDEDGTEAWGTADGAEDDELFGAATPPTAADGEWEGSADGYELH